MDVISNNLTEDLFTLVGKICSKCKKHKASVLWTNSGMELVHRCDCCALKEQLAHAKKMEKLIPKLERKLRVLGNKCK